jgi:hypothetical protein
MFEPFYLDASTTIENACQAAVEGRLQLCLPYPGGKCRYHVEGTGDNRIGCAIGVNLPEELAQNFDNQDEAGFASLVEEGAIKTNNAFALSDLQAEHDRLVFRIATKAITKDQAVEQFITYCDELLKRGT